MEATVPIPVAVPATTTIRRPEERDGSMLFQRQDIPQGRDGPMYNIRQEAVVHHRSVLHHVGIILAVKLVEGKIIPTLLPLPRQMMKVSITVTTTVLRIICWVVAVVMMHMPVVG